MASGMQSSDQSVQILFLFFRFYYFQTRNQELAANLDEHVQSNKELHLHNEELVSLYTVNQQFFDLSGQQVKKQIREI